MGEATVFPKAHHFENARTGIKFAMERAGINPETMTPEVARFVENMVEVRAFDFAAVAMAARTEHENFN